MTVPDTPFRFGPYEVEQPLGRGAIGTVYAARDTRIGRRVALKTIQLPERQFEDATAAQEFFRRLQREAEVCGSLHHPNIVTLYEAGYENDRISYLAMELIDGETLLRLMQRLRPGFVPAELALRITADVLRGLVHAHARGIVHRDIKPANILITAEGTAKVADFGIARPEKSTMTAAGALIGTPNYMSPEQITGAELTPRADVFALGTVLYEMLTGLKPFAAADITGILHNILRQEPRPVTETSPLVPSVVSEFVSSLLQKSPDARPTSEQALMTAEQLLAPAPPAGTARPTSPAADSGLQPMMRRRISRRLAAPLIAGALLLAVVPAAVLFSRVNDTPTTAIPAKKLAEFEEKRRALTAADALFSEGRYEESLVAYEAYLAKYPHSVAAEDGRDRAAAAIATANTDAPEERAASRRGRSKRDEDISPREMLNRIKRVFKR